MRPIKLLLLFIFFISPFAMANNQIVYFEPTDVTLTGDIITLTFPGPPNYESIKNGDKEETGPYLILTDPIDIKRQPNTQASIDEPQPNVKLLQLVVVNNDDWKHVKHGNHVSVTGTLSSAITGHHHARALLEIKKINVISKQNVDNKQLDTLTDEDKKFLRLQNLQQ